MASITHISQKYRIAVSRIFGVAIVFLVLFSASTIQIGLAGQITIEILSFVLVLIAAFGRLWALAYISGHKTKDLIMDGPYSMVRNPLYLFSFIGAFGLGLFSKNIMVLLLILVMFGFYYPFVIRGEEKHLREVHGGEFEKYCEKTPMFVPRPSAFSEEPYYTINARLFRKAFFSVVWFPLIFILMLALERLHQSGVVPVLFTIP